MAVTGDTVVWVGRDDAGRALYRDADETVKLEGAFVAPSFVDAHVHATSAGLVLNGLDLTGATSLDECLRTIRDYVRARPGELIWGHGWEETAWPELRPPSRDELDAVVGDAPVYLSRIDVHSALVSTALLDRAPGARHADGWSPDGPLARQAHHHVRRAAMESLGSAQRREIQRAFLQHAASLGVTSVHECAGPDISSAEDLRELLAASEEGDVPEVVGYWGEPGAIERARSLGARGVGGDLFVDGALGSRTACLCEPYTDDPSTSGALYLDAEAIAEHLVSCTQAGVQGGFHVIGDAAVAQVVEGFERAARRVGAATLASRGHRLEHLEMVGDEQAKKLASWGVIASMQPLFDDAWGGTERQYSLRLGLPRGARLNPFAAVAAAGMPLALGSDVPVTPVDPWGSVRAAVHHRTEGFGISPRAAFLAHTRGGYRAAGVRDELAGTLQPGAPANFAVWEAGDLVVSAPDTRTQRWSTDPRSLVPGLPSVEPGTDLPRCAYTARRGRTVYARESFSGL
ncbi:MAG: amidohydrolase family protein [Pseudonocardiaceae bacterium]|nr:amidohydrolase family protein [Pseudonocardiaceae bacterium]